MKYDYEEHKSINAAAKLWNCSRTEAIIRSCIFTHRMRRNLYRALQHPDMTPELAEVLSTEYITLNYRVETSIDVH